MSRKIKWHPKKIKWEDEDRYNTGYRWVVVHKNTAMAYSRTKEKSKLRLGTAKLNNPDLKTNWRILPVVLPIGMEFKVPDNIPDEKINAEIKRITDLLVPVTREEEEEVKRVALNNVMMKDLEFIVINAITIA